VGARAVPVGVRVDRHLLTRKRISFCQIFLRLSRACLGKMILFSIKWHRKRYAVSLPDMLAIRVHRPNA
jgi:hypothetical protein